jgi:hypothetical protein
MSPMMLLGDPQVIESLDLIILALNSHRPAGIALVFKETHLPQVLFRRGYVLPCSGFREGTGH